MELSFRLSRQRPRLCSRRVLKRLVVVTLSVLGGSLLLLLTFHLLQQQQGEEEERRGASAGSLGFDRGIRRLLPEIRFGQARFDNKRLLRIFDFFQVGTEWEQLVSRFGICLATQSSLERLYWLPQLLAKWSGPLSLALHISSEEEWLVLELYTRYLDRCSPGFRNQVALHLALPSSLSFQRKGKLENQWNNNNNTSHLEELHQALQLDCQHAKDYLAALMTHFPTTNDESLRLKEVYPQNHMRNIARKGCGTNWTFSTDVDIIPRDGLAESLQAFYESVQSSPDPCDKCAFVIPTFELDETVSSFPTSKKGIVDHFNSGTARQFHVKIFGPGHKPTNYSLWTNSNLEDDGPIKVSHQIDSSKTYLYEPFYVSSDTIPPFDERFLGYGFTRNSQFQAALYAGWNFSVLTPAFAIHWGLQSHKTLLSPKKKEGSATGKNLREQQKSSNYQLYKKIVKEMKLKKEEGLF